MIHDLHDVSGVHAGKVGQNFIAQIKGVVEDSEYVGHGPRIDANLGLVVALVDRQPQVAVQARLESGLEGSIHRSDLVRYGGADRALRPVTAVVLDELA